MWSCWWQTSYACGRLLQEARACAWGAWPTPVEFSIGGVLLSLARVGVGNQVMPAAGRKARSCALVTRGLCPLINPPLILELKLHKMSEVVTRSLHSSSLILV